VNAATPVLLLDVDGVLNACTRTPDRTIWPTWQQGDAISSTEGRSYPIRWARQVIDFITDLHHSTRVEVRWHTTWQHDAQSVIAPLLGLPHFEVADAPEFGDREYRSAAIRAGRPTWWKLPAAERVVQVEGRPLIWLDDDIDSGLTRGYDTLANFHTIQPTLMVCPKEYTGLTPKHLRRINEFIASLEQEPTP
jgi:hypothetical protein